MTGAREVPKVLRICSEGIVLAEPISAHVAGGVDRSHHGEQRPG